MLRLIAGAISVMLSGVPAAYAQGTWPLRAWDKPFDYEGPSHAVDYVPLQSVGHPWRFCVSYPHLKDAYWLSVNYGMMHEAQRLGVGFRLVEAGGYPNLDRQIAQIEDCVSQGADALIVGTVSFAGLTPTILKFAKTIPVIAAVNDISDPGITAKVGVSWYDMGHATGQIIARRHPKGSAPVRVGWFPGPEGAGWVTFVERGFRDALAASSARIVATKYGDTGREIQVSLVEELLESGANVDILAGNAPMAEAAVSILRARGLSDRIGVVSEYMTHAVFRGVRRGRILAAPSDLPVVQGRLAIEVAARAVEGKLEQRHLGPAIVTVTQENIDRLDPAESLAPASFIPVFDVPPRGATGKN